MSAWTIHEPLKRLSPLKLISIRKNLQGQYLRSIDAVLQINDSVINVTYSLGDSQPWLNIDISTFWLERGSDQIGTPKLRIQFPLAVKNAKGTYEIPFGSIERNMNNGQEVPAINWADVTGLLNDSNDIAGCLLLNDCKNGHSVDNSTLRLTLLRSSYSPDPLPEAGEHTMHLALLPHSGTLSPAAMTKFGMVFNQALQVINTDVHKGKFPPQSGDLVSVSAENIVVADLKRSEDGSSLIMRFFEAAGKDTLVEITPDPVYFGSILQARQTDLLERPFSSDITVKKNSFSVNMSAYGITTVMLNMKK